jgi:serine/threonine-protein kinase ATR
LLRDFIGLNATHLHGEARAKSYRPLGRLLRDYHSARSDLGDDSAFSRSMPKGRDGRDWAQLYRDLAAAGWRTIVSLMFERLEPKEWRDLAGDTATYARRFAKAHALGTKAARIEAVEIGNEPGEFTDDEYRTVLRAMGAAFHEAAPGVKVATAALTTGMSHEFYKSVDCLEGVADCYDVLTVHTYAEIQGWPTWERSYPEDPRQQNYLTDIGRLAAWRDEHARGKEIWITEFGYDAIDLPANPAGKWKHWRGLTDLQQAQWTVRSWLLFATLPVTRAYYFFFNDCGEPKNHHASGMTRNNVRRPLFFATAHLLATLGAFRLARIVVEEPGQAIVLEFTHGRDQARRIWVAWSPTGDGRVIEFTLPSWPGRVERAERMPLDATPVPAAPPDRTRRVTLTESPLYLFLRGITSRSPKSS